jgi:filamentous hemagglutinin
MNNLFDINNLAPLIGLKRSDDSIEFFINKVSTIPTITVDKDDDADDEFIEFKRSGFGLHFMNNVLESIHFQFGRKNSDYTKFEYPLPLGIRFEQSKSEILNILGSPVAQGGGQDDFFGHVPDWFKYNKDGYAIHIEFDPDSKSVESVTIMAED